MMIYMLAIAMTAAMLIATLFGLHQEAQRVRIKTKDQRSGGFSVPNRRY
jgi:hypothetical protein